MGFSKDLEQMHCRISAAFTGSDGPIWLNCAHQGPLPLVSAQEVRQAVEWKTKPWELTTERFSGVPTRLKSALGRLTGVPAEDIILANGASYGLHLLANGLPLVRGDEVLLMRGDFPSNILPWLRHRERGVAVRQLKPARYVLSAGEVQAQLSDRTRVLCMSWVHSFSGWMADLQSLGTLCRERGIHFIVNATQGLGSCPLDASILPVDALVGVGWKWLCGPYATGFCWIRPPLRKTLKYNQAYWLAGQNSDDLGSSDEEVHLDEQESARRFDIFGTANFFNFKPWTSSLELLLDLGIESIHRLDQGLVSRFISGIDTSRYELISPAEGPQRSSLIFISHRGASQNQKVFEFLKKRQIFIAFRRGRLRIAPHFYNTEQDIDRVLAALHDFDGA